MYFIQTFGCQMNEYDSERIAAVFDAHGMLPTDSMKDADYIILNTCSVREGPQQKVGSLLGRLKQYKRQRGTKFGVAGCVAQQVGKRIMSRHPYVDFVFGTEAVGRLGEILARVEAGERVLDVQMGADDFSIGEFSRQQQISASVTIMKGCTNFCSYCIVPYVRGKELSRKPQEILTEIKRLVDNGVREITLLGQNVNSYGKNLDESISFPHLLRMAGDVEGLKRLRFITSHPKDFTREMALAMRDVPACCEYLHLPLQAGDDDVLSRMNRGYSYGEYRDNVLMAKELIPGLALSSDFIVGFPGETDAQFRRTLNAIEEIGYETLYAFKYSVRPGTAAAKLEDTISDEEKGARLNELLALQEKVTAKLSAGYVGKTAEVLVEGQSRKGESEMTGRIRQNRIVNFDGQGRVQSGDIVQVRITEAKRNTLYGELL